MALNWGLGQFADLREVWQKQEGAVFLRGD